MNPEVQQMLAEKIIRAFGTEQELSCISEALAPSVLLSKREIDEKWEIIDLNNIELDKYVFDAKNDAIETLKGEVFFDGPDKCLITKNQDKEMKIYLRLFLEQSQKMEKLEEEKQSLTKFSYQLINLDKLVPSLMEPFSFELLLNLIIDSLSELFVSSAAAYYMNQEGKLFKVGNTGDYVFPKEMNQIENCCPGTVKIHKDCLVASLNDEVQKQYFLFFKREQAFRDEEKTIMKTLIYLVEKSRKLLSEEEKSRKYEECIDQFTYLIEMIECFSSNTSSAEDLQGLNALVVSSLRELFLSDFVAVYARDRHNEDVFKSISSFDNAHENRTIVYEKTLSNGKISLDVDFFYQKCFAVKTSLDSEFLIFMGRSILDDLINNEVTTNIEMILSMILSNAYSNVDLLGKINRVEMSMEECSRNASFLSSIQPDIDKSKNKDHLEKKINFLSEFSSDMSLKKMTLYNEMEEKESEENYLVTIKDSSNCYGSVAYRKKDKLNAPIDENFLIFLSQVALSTYEKIKIFAPEKNIINVEDMQANFLKAKYRLAGFPGEPEVFILKTDQYDLNTIKRYGTGLIVGNDLFFATILSESELKIKSQKEPYL